MELSLQPPSDLPLLFPKQYARTQKHDICQAIGCRVQSLTSDHPARVGDALLEITRNWETFSVEPASQEWTSRCAVFRMNYWIFGNSDGLIEALSEGLLDDPEANQTF
jgi:hypothetical protein